MPGRAGVLAVGLLVALAGCTGPAPQACTDIGSEAGVAVTVERSVAGDVDDLVLRVCWAGRCADRAVVLRPGSVAVPDDCPPGGDPDRTCSASASPDGTLVGFVDVADLPAGPVEVSGRLRRGTTTVRLAAVDLRADVTYPNGPRCAAGASQAAVTVTATGLRG